MKKLALLALATLTMTSCWTRIWTVAPAEETTVVVREQPAQPTYTTTTVITPNPRTTTVTTFTATSYNTDPCFYLDLNAVAAAFAESRSVQDFEQLLNSSRYLINNLDLNHDGWVDYLRIIETHRGYYHTLLIQACLAPGVFQDVATIVAERRSDVLYTEVIGDRYIYGYNYIVRPVFVKRPPMWDVYGRPHYSPWSSPYHYGYLPSYYHKPAPIYLNHYQAYVDTYMRNHGYCHHCDYPSRPFYDGYGSMTQEHSHQDYQNQHPNDSFEQRVTRTGQATRTGGVSVRNAGQLREYVNESKKSAPSTATTNASTATTSTRSTDMRQPTSMTTTSGSVRSGNTTTRTTETKQPATTTRTESKPTSTTSTRTSSTRTESKQTTTRQPSTSIDTRVDRNGATRTTVKTTYNTGRTTSVKREGSSSTRSRSSSSSSSSNGSVRSSQGSTSGSTPRSGQRGR